jgi:hypothetical protein
MKIVVESIDHNPESYKLYKLLINNYTKIHYLIDYKTESTFIKIYDNSFSIFFDTESWEDHKVKLPAIIELDVKNPMKTFNRFGKLLLLK